MLIKDFVKEGILDIDEIPCPLDAIQYLAITGSQINHLDTESSDLDIQGFYLGLSFLKQTVKYHGLVSPRKKMKYDIDLLSFQNYFEGCIKCNPRLLRSLFIVDEHVLHCSSIGKLLRGKRHLFLSKNIVSACQSGDNVTLKKLLIN